MKRPLARLRTEGSLSRAVSTNFAGGIALQLALLVSGVVLARTLGPTNRGNMSLLVLVSAIAWQLGGLGIPYALTFAAARAPGAAKRSLESVARPIAIQAVVAAALAAVALGFLTIGRPGYVRFGATFTVLAIIATVYERCGLGILQGLRHFLSFNLLRMASNVLFSITAAVLWLSGDHAFLPYAISWAVCQAVVAPVCVLLARRTAASAETDVSMPLDKPGLLTFGRRSLFGGDPPVETYRVDQAAVAIFLAPAALGFYVAALAFTNLPRFIAQSFSLVATPSIAGQTTHLAAVKSMWRFFFAAIPFYMALVIVLWIGAPWLVEFFFGSDFERSANISRILLVATALYCARRVLSDSARGAGFPGIGSIAEVSSIASVIPLFAVFIPLWGLDGVAWALVGSSTVALVTLILGVRHLTRSGEVPTSWSEVHSEHAELDGLVEEPTITAGEWRPRRPSVLSRAAAPFGSVGLSSAAQIGAVVIGALVIGAAVAVGPLLAVVAFVLAVGISGLFILGFDRSAFLVTGLAVGMVTFNALRPVSSATISDVFFVIALVLIIGSLADPEREIVGLPGWLWLSAGLFALAAGLVAIFPAPASQAALFFPGGVLSTLPAEAGDSTSNVGALLRLELALLLIPFVLAQVAYNWDRIRRLAEFWVVGAAVASLVGIAAYLGILHVSSLLGGNQYAEVTRVKGLTTHPNVFGVTAAMALPVAIVLYSTSQGTRRRAYLVSLGLLLSAIALSGSRAAILGAIFGLCLLALLDSRTRVFLRRAAIFAVGAIVVAGLATFQNVPVIQRLVGDSEVNTSNEGREAIYSKVWSEIEHRPIVGHGFEYLRGSHNIYLQAMHAGGAVGLAALLALVFGVIRTGLAGSSDTRQGSRSLHTALLASALTWLAVDGLFEPAIFDRYLYIPIGLLVAVWAVSRQTVPAAQRPGLGPIAIGSPGRIDSAA